MYFPTEAVVLCLEPDSGGAVIGGPTACNDDRELRDGDGVNDGSADPFGPAFGQRKAGSLPMIEHGNPSNGNPVISDEGST